MNNSHVILDGYGGTEHLRVVQGDVPTPGKKELLVRVDFAGVAFADVMQRHGQYPGAPSPPYIPGYDIVGTVQSVGAETKLKPGTRIAALTQFGGYAQYVTVKEEGVAVVPDSLPSDKAVCLVLNYLSAYQMLHSVAHLQPGDVVLVHGAAGGVGTAALQLGKVMGLLMLGTASTQKQNLVQELGATAIDYQTQDFVEEVLQLHPKGVRAVLDPISPENWKRSRQVLQRGGHLLAYGGVGLMNRKTDQLSASTMSMVFAALRMKLSSWSTKFSFFAVSVRNPKQTHEDLQLLMGWAAEGKLQPVISEILPLAQVADAHSKLAAASVRGKMILDCR